MFRRMILAAVSGATLWSVAPATAEAQVISRNNPYRSFNLHGVNYGSMQWEQQHRSGTGPRPSLYGSSRPSGRSYRR